jgi:hypothetical protein
MGPQADGGPADGERSVTDAKQMNNDGAARWGAPLVYDEPVQDVSVPRAGAGGR